MEVTPLSPLSRGVTPPQLGESQSLSIAAGNNRSGDASPHPVKNRCVFVTNIFLDAHMPYRVYKAEADSVFETIRRFWSVHIDALERNLDRMESSALTKRKTKKKRPRPNRQPKKGETK